MGIVEGIIEKLSEYFVVNSSPCVRVRHKAATCADCMDACPENAVRITRAGGKVLVDWEKCTDCGRCITACKNSVFSMRRADYEVISADVAKQSADTEKRVRFSCAKSGFENSVNLPALSHINRRVIINTAAFGAGSMEFIYGDCSSCRMKGCLDLLKKETSFAARIFALCGKDIPLIIKSAESKTALKPLKKNSLRERLGSNADLRLNRREFFGFLKNGTQRTVGKTLHYLTENDSDKTKTLFSSSVSLPSENDYSKSLKILGGDILIKNMQKNGLLPYPSINEEKCVKCGICARMCPFSVFETITETVKGREVTAAIKINPESCTACGLCTISCPYGAAAVDFGNI